MKHINPKYVVPIIPSQNNYKGIYPLLRKMGAPENCWVTSESRDFDSREMGLVDALEAIQDMGAWLSCIPGILGYASDEDGRWVLHRPQTRTVRR
jgi:hypothetical protein